MTTLLGGRRNRVLIAALSVLVIAVAVPITLGLLQLGTDPPTGRQPTTIAATSCGFTDEFTGTTVDPAWERNRPDTRITVAGGVADIDAPDGTDIFRANMTAPMLLRPVTGDFVLEAALETTPSVFYQAAGLLLWNGPSSYVRIERGFGETTGTMGFEYKDGGAHKRVHGPLRNQNPLKVEATRVVLRMTRAGDAITAAWRPADRPDFASLGTIQMTLPDSVRVGVSALNRAQFGAKPTPFHARFEHVRLTC